MTKTKSLSAFAVAALLGVFLVACGGGGGDSSHESTSAQVESQVSPRTAGRAAAAGAARGGKDRPPRSNGASERRFEGDDGGRPSIATDPAVIPNAMVTKSGAVQTLKPSAAAQAEAMENSYASIRAYGEETSGSETTDISFALVQYLTAKEQGDWETACVRLYSALRDSLSRLAATAPNPDLRGTSCPVIYAALAEHAPESAGGEAAQVDIASVRREGDRAFVIYKTPDTLSADMPLYLEDGAWRVGALEAYVLTPEQAGGEGGTQ